MNCNLALACGNPNMKFLGFNNSSCKLLEHKKESFGVFKSWAFPVASFWNIMICNIKGVCDVLNTAVPTGYTLKNCYLDCPENVPAASGICGWIDVPKLYFLSLCTVTYLAIGFGMLCLGLVVDSHCDVIRMHCYYFSTAQNKSLFLYNMHIIIPVFLFFFPAS